jgi:hypothetical protein
LTDVAVILVRQLGAFATVHALPTIDMGIAPRFAYLAIAVARAPDQPKRKNEQPHGQN